MREVEVSDWKIRKLAKELATIRTELDKLLKGVKR